MTPPCKEISVTTTSSHLSRLEQLYRLGWAACYEVVSIVTLTQTESLVGPWPGHALYTLFISYLLSDTKTCYCPQFCSDDDDDDGDFKFKQIINSI